MKKIELQVTSETLGEPEKLSEMCTSETLSELEKLSEMCKGWPGLSAVW